LSVKVFRARVQDLGRITIPDEIRATEGISKGDFVDVNVKLAKKAEEIPAE
jgi:AbrB family looped-hinge helix DNA binding protein